MIREIGLESFDQFVFLQHFVFTFDERRHLLFWDQPVLEQTLFLCVGLNARDAQHADELRRDAQRADSSVRNLQWQATKLTKELKELEALTDAEDAQKKVDRVLEQYRELLDVRDAAEGKLRKLQEQREDVELQFSETTGAVATLTNEYEKAFTRLLPGESEFSSKHADSGPERNRWQFRGSRRLLA